VELDELDVDELDVFTSAPGRVKYRSKFCAALTNSSTLFGSTATVIHMLDEEESPLVAKI
jgi:hypothetical protein